MVPSASEAFAEIEMFAGLVNVALLAGLVTFTKGAVFAGGLMMRVTALEVTIAPPLSVAVAVMLYVPTGIFVQLNVKGLLVAVPNKLVPWKNWTFVIVPSVSVAAAAIVTLARAVRVALLTGFVMLTAGGTFAGALTVTLTTIDVVVAFKSS